MIKVNLATRKQSNVNSGGGGGAKSFSLSGFKFDAIDLGQLKDLPLAKIGGSIVFAIALMYGESVYKDQQMKKVEDEVAVVQEQKTALQSELNKVKGYDQQKKALDADETILRTKIETIQKLITDRQAPPKILLALSNGIPADVWISQFTVSGDSVKIKGNSIGFNEVPDFVKSLGESAYFTDLKTDGIKKVRDELGIEIAEFEISAKRRASP